MKKQLLIAAVAATMGTAAIADIAITGNASYEFKNISNGTATDTNQGETELNIVLDGSHGDTRIHLEQEIKQSASTTGASGVEANHENLDYEDMWLSTKVGDINLKFGNWDGSVNANTGQIKNNARSTNKVSATTAIKDIKLGFWTTPGNGSGDGFTVGGTIAGVNIGLKQAGGDAGYTDINVSGEVSGIKYRFDDYNSDVASSDAQFASAEYTVRGVTLKAGKLRADKASVLTETDAYFSGTSFNVGDAYIQEIIQGSASMDLYGNTVTVAAATSTEDNGTENDSTKVSLSRSLAGGTTLSASYADVENSNADTSKETFAAKLKVSF